MNSIEQYIKLYDENCGVIEQKSSSPLNRLRTIARNTLIGVQLPDRHTEGYEKTSLNEIFAHDFGLNINRMTLPVDIAASFRCEVPNMSTWLGVVVNDIFHPTAAICERLPEGVLFCSFSNAPQKGRTIIEENYGQIASLSDASTALNSLLVQDGVLIYIPDGVHLEKPLQLVDIFSSPVDTMSLRRVLIVMGKNSSAQLLVCDHTQDNERNYLSSQVVEIKLGNDSELDLYDIEESSNHTSRVSSMYVKQCSGSKLLINGMTISNGTTRNDFHIDIVGEHSETRLMGMAIGSKQQHIDNNSIVRHIGKHCHSSQHFKYVLDQEATGAFEGGIIVSSEADYTEAYQSNRNLLASRSATMHTKPQLEIYNDDVKCSHGATTGQLDSEALFYMQTRGIPEKEARTMLMQAFMSDVIDSVRMDGLADRLRHLVKLRFDGHDSFCGSCHTNNACRDAVGGRLK